MIVSQTLSVNAEPFIWMRSTIQTAYRKLMDFMSFKNNFTEVSVKGYL